MGAPLNDITIYYSGTKIKEAPDDWEYRFIANHVADAYFNRLQGYKPPKTSRICIHLCADEIWKQPGYSGSLCYYSNIIEEDKYLNLDMEGKHKYLLDLLHDAITEVAEIYNWDKNVFNNAYSEVVSNGFDFSKVYTKKRSVNRKYIACAIVRKTYSESSLFVQIETDKKLIEVQLLEKKNYGIYDRLYRFAKECKWIDNNSFGFSNEFGTSFYSVTDSKVITRLSLGYDDY